MGVVKDLQSEDVDAKKLEAWLLKSTLRSIKDGCIGYGIPGTLLEAFVGGPTYSALLISMFMYPPLYGGLWVKPKAIHPPEKAEESKVQLLVSAQMFGQVVMRVYNGNLGDSRSNSLDWVPECGSPRSLSASMFWVTIDKWRTGIFTVYVNTQ